MAEYTDKYSVKVEYDTDSFNRFKRAKEEFYKKDSADDKANAKIKSDNNKHLNDKELVELKNNLKQKYINVQAALEKERIAKQRGKELDIKEAIAVRKVMEHELKLFEQANRTSLAMQLTDYRTAKAKELIEFRKHNEQILRQSKLPTFGSQAFVSQLKSEQRKFAPGTSDYQNLGIMIKGFEGDFKKAGIQIDSFNTKVEKGVTSALRNATNQMGPYIAGMVGMAGATKLWDLSLDTKKLDVTRSHFKGTADELENLRIASARTVDEASLMKMSIQAGDLGVSLEKQVILMGLAEDASDKYGGSVEENFMGLVNSSEGATKVLKTLGIQKGLYEEALKSLAKEQKLELNNLTAEQEKRLRLDAIIKVSNVTYDETIKKTQDAADEQESLIVFVKDLTLNYGWAVAKGLIPFAAALDKLPAAVRAQIKNFQELKSTMSNFSDDLNKATFGIVGLRKEAQTPIRVKLEVEGLQNLDAAWKQIQNMRTGSVTNDLQQLSYWSGKSVEELEKLAKEKGFVSFGKELDAQSSNKNNSITGSNSGTGKTTQELKEQLNLIAKLEEDLVKANERLKANLNDIGSERQIRAEILEIEKEIYRLRTGIVNDTPFKMNDPVEDLKGWQQRIAEFGTGRFPGTPSEGNNRQADEDTRSALQKQLDFENQRLGYVQQMWTASNSMLENFGLMKGDTAEMVKWINSIIQGIGAGKSFFDGLTGLLSFIPGGSLIAGAAGAGGGLGRLANLSNIGSGNRLSPSRMIRESGSAKMNTTIIIKNPVRFEKAFEVESINRSLRTSQVAG